eukprot:gb/GECH01012779.1/.p1 GENE.gb/GECH01012779.1/~~gb/GECH01012779.1/.p1  ORF type:complete len:530 (+),score=159.41 gb/GECH01012779.1/:1-1590(+)
MTVGSVILYPNEYIHIINNDDGKVHTEIGPKRVVLKGYEQILSSKQECVIVHENEYAVIVNPFDETTGKCLMGDRKVVMGPSSLALHYNEKLEGGRVYKIHVLGEGEALLLEAQQEHDGKPAGHMWRVDGPCKYVPSKYEKIVRELEAVYISEGQGIYVKNTETSKTRLVRGPCAYMLDVNEEYYYKPYTQAERSALKLSSASSYWATSVYLMKNELLCVLDYEKNEEKVYMGPMNCLLGPSEGVRVLSLSAGKPKQTNALKVAKVRTGPDFMSDIFTVRTRDNADLQLHLTYKWQFIIDQGSSDKVFSLNDFIGYACQSICSGIREEAARYDFEEFHNKTVSIIRNALFSQNEVEMTNGENYKFNGLYYSEARLAITEVDVKEVSPVNEEIGMWLNQSIKRNMVIVCQKIEQEANLNAEKENVQGQAEIQRLKEKLIDIENENYRLETVQKAKIEGQSRVEKARAEKEATEIKDTSKLELTVEQMESIMSLLKRPGGTKYLDLIRSENFSKVNQNWYVNSDSKVDLPF